MSNSSDNKRIAKNSLYLYIRMGVMMLVMFYTSRVVLSVLGIDRYGTWNIVNSFVVSFSFISAPLVTSTQRFLNYDMGIGGLKLNRIFNQSLIIFICLCAILLIAFETVGLWFLNSKMNFGEESLSTVNILYQLMIGSFLVKLVRLPYEATIIAHEKMSFYAVICLIEVLVLLAIVYLLQLFPTQQMLVAYGVLTIVAYVIVTLCYVIYCRRKFSCTKVNLKVEKPLLKEMSSFSGWNLLVSVSSMTATSGLNIVANLFFGVVVNAAYGITSQIAAAVNLFISNFQRAVNPQIVKSVAAKDYERVRSLVYNASKFSFAVVFVIAFPLVTNIDCVLSIWLGKNVPAYAPLFCKINMYYLLVVSCASIFDYTILAFGKIRNYQIISSALIFSNIVIIYIAYSLGASPEALYITKTSVEVIIFGFRLSILRRRKVITYLSFIRKVLLPCVVSVMIAVAFYYLVSMTIGYGEGLSKLCYSLLTFVPVYIISCYYIILSRSQREAISHKVKRYRRTL